MDLSVPDAAATTLAATEPKVIVQAASFQTGKGTNFIRCDFIAGRWLRTPTSKGDQPPEGFTISAEEEPDQIERLCSAYERADLPGRKLIRTFADPPGHTR